MIKAIMIVFTLGLFVLMVKLGFWQLDRAEHKQFLQQQLNERIASAPLSWRDVLAQQYSNPSGYQAQLQLRATSLPLIALDNQTHQGQVGYLIYQLFSGPTTSSLLLVELGFAPAGFDRSVLPDIAPLTGEHKLTGKLYRKHANPLSLALLAESPSTNNIIRIQNLAFAELSGYLGRDILPLALQPDTLAGISLKRHWQPIAMPAQKHLGYAVQWFALAAALALLSLVFMLRQRRDAQLAKLTLAQSTTNAKTANSSPTLPQPKEENL